MTDTPTLVEQLLNPTMEERYDGMVLSAAITVCTMGEPAAALTAQAEEIERLKKERDEARLDSAGFKRVADDFTKIASHAQQAEITTSKRALAAEAALAKMREALKPFAGVEMMPYSVMASDDASIELIGFELIGGIAFIKAAAFRQALVALSALDAPGGA